MATIVLAAVLAAVTFGVVSGVRLALGYRRLVTELRTLNGSHLPPPIAEELPSFWVESMQSQLFYEVTMGDVSWSKNLPVSASVRSVRRAFHFFAWGNAATLAALLALLVSTR